MIDPTSAIAVGAAAPLLLKLLDLGELYKLPKERRPNFGQVLYWVSWLGEPIVGGFVVWLNVQGQSTISPLLAAQLGVTGPLLLRQLAKIVPEPGSHKNS